MASDPISAADWVSAVSAAVQALGAIGAIFFSVKIARDAEQREGKAERASIARAEAAEKAALQRIVDAENAAYNRPIDLIERYARPVLNDFQAHIDEHRPKIESFAGHIWVGLQTQNVSDLQRVVSRLANMIDDPPLAVAVEEFAPYAKPWDANRPATMSEYVEALEERRNELLERLESILAFRR